MKPYKLSLVQALTNDDKKMQKIFCESMLKMVKDNEAPFLHIVFSDKATFHLCGTVNRLCTIGEHITHLK